MITARRHRVVQKKIDKIKEINENKVGNFYVQQSKLDKTIEYDYLYFGNNELGRLINLQVEAKKITEKLKAKAKKPGRQLTTLAFSGSPILRNSPQLSKLNTMIGK